MFRCSAESAHTQTSKMQNYKNKVNVQRGIVIFFTQYEDNVGIRRISQERKVTKETNDKEEMTHAATTLNKNAVDG